MVDSLRSADCTEVRQQTARGYRSEPEDQRCDRQHFGFVRHGRLINQWIAKHVSLDHAEINNCERDEGQLDVKIRTHDEPGEIDGQKDRPGYRSYPET